MVYPDPSSGNHWVALTFSVSDTGYPFAPFSLMPNILQPGDVGDESLIIPPHALHVRRDSRILDQNLVWGLDELVWGLDETKRRITRSGGWDFRVETWMDDLERLSVPQVDFLPSGRVVMHDLSHVGPARPLHVTREAR